jgi:hypothetical protein
MRRPHRHHHGPADGLRNAQKAELSEGLGERKEERGRSEDADRRGEDGTGAQAIWNPAADKNEDGESDEVGRHTNIEIDSNSVALCHLGQDGCNDRAIKVLRKECGRDEDGGEDSGAIPRGKGSKKLGNGAIRGRERRGAPELRSACRTQQVDNRLFEFAVRLGTANALNCAGLVGSVSSLTRPATII